MLANCTWQTESVAFYITAICPNHRRRSSLNFERARHFFWKIYIWKL